MCNYVQNVEITKCLKWLNWKVYCSASSILTNIQKQSIQKLPNIILDAI